MSQKPSDIVAPAKPKPGEEFDTTGEMWDRLVDDIINQGAPCMETVEKLVNESSQYDPGPGLRKDKAEED